MFLLQITRQSVELSHQKGITSNRQCCNIGSEVKRKQDAIQQCYTSNSGDWGPICHLVSFRHYSPNPHKNPTQQQSSLEQSSAVVQTRWSTWYVSDMFVHNWLVTLSLLFWLCKFIRVYVTWYNNMTFIDIRWHLHFAVYRSEQLAKMH